MNLSEETTASLFISSLDFLCTAEGNGLVRIEGDVKNFRLNVSGSIEVHNKLFSHIVYAYLKDETEVSFEGQTDYLQIKSIDESYLNSTEMISRECLVTVSDYGDVSLFAAEKLDITGTKFGTIVYKGDPEITNYYISESVVIRGNEKAKKIKEYYAGIK